MIMRLNFALILFISMGRIIAEECLLDFDLCYWIHDPTSFFNATEGDETCHTDNGQLAIFPAFTNISQLARILSPIIPPLFAPVFSVHADALINGFYIGYMGHRDTLTDQYNITEIDGTPVNDESRDALREVEGAGLIFQTCYNLVNFSLAPPLEIDISPYDCKERNRIICSRWIPKTASTTLSTAVTNIPTTDHTNGVTAEASDAQTTHGCCPCGGGPYVPPGDVQESIEKRKKELEVDKRSLSSTIRAKTCAKDERPSSTAMGAVAVVIISVVIGGIVLLDFPLLIDMVKQIKSLIRPKRK